MHRCMNLCSCQCLSSCHIKCNALSITCAFQLPASVFMWICWWLYWEFAYSCGHISKFACEMAFFWCFWSIPLNMLPVYLSCYLNFSLPSDSWLHLEQVISYLNEIFGSLLSALSDPSDEVSFLNIPLINFINIPSECCWFIRNKIMQHSCNHLWMNKELELLVFCLQCHV